MKPLSVALTALAALSLSGTADAAACRGAHGKFIKCPTAASAPAKPKPKQCRDAKGKYIKCDKAKG